MTSTGFGVMRPRTCCFRQNNITFGKKNKNISTFGSIIINVENWVSGTKAGCVFLCTFVDICPVQLATCLLPCRSTSSKLEDSTRAFVFCFFYDSATTALARP